MFIAKDEDLRPFVNPCAPSPCGPYSECRDINGQASCACLATYMGTPPNCRPECLINSECLSNQACIQKKCRNPCDGVCGVGAVCNVINHTPTCSCPSGFTGDSFVICRLIPEEGKTVGQRISRMTITFSSGFFTTWWTLAEIEINSGPDEGGSRTLDLLARLIILKNPRIQPRRPTER